MALGKSRFGQLLLKRGVITPDILEKALQIQEEETGPNARELGKILVHDFNINHDAVYGLLAEMYAFRTIEIDAQKWMNLK